MVFPMETEHRVKGIALSLCQDHLRKVVDITRKTAQLVDDFAKEDENSVKQLYVEIQSLGEEINADKRKVAQELAEIGAILINREDYLRFTDLTSEVSDLCKGVAFRLLEMITRQWRISQHIKDRLASLAGAVFEAILKLREAIITLNYGSSSVLEKVKDVEDAEKRVDNLYRELEIEILNSQMEIPVLLLLRDVIQLLEDTADKIEDASDATSILVFAM